MEDKMQLKYKETVSQPYNNSCKHMISAGFVEGHPTYTLYLELKRQGEEPVYVLVRPDEMAAIAHCAGGVLWSVLGEINKKVADKETTAYGEGYIIAKKEAKRAMYQELLDALRDRELIEALKLLKRKWVIE